MPVAGLKMQQAVAIEAEKNRRGAGFFHKAVLLAQRLLVQFSDGGKWQWAPEVDVIGHFVGSHFFAAEGENFFLELVLIMRAGIGLELYVEIDDVIAGAL